jgi:hypothetical protein
VVVIRQWLKLRIYGLVGAGGETRTLTGFIPPDFESGASTNSAIPAGGAGEKEAQLYMESCRHAKYWLVRGGGLG